MPSCVKNESYTWDIHRGVLAILYDPTCHYENINKRVIKSPKVYFHDTGLVSHLLGIETPDHARRDPLRGGLYENLVILEILKYLYNRGERPDLYFYRDTHGNEVDLIIRRRRTLIPVEIKSAATFTEGFLKGIERFRGLVKDRAEDGYVLYDGAERFRVKGVRVENLLHHGGVDGILGEGTR